MREVKEAKLNNRSKKKIEKNRFWVYDWKKALLTAVVLSLGALFIFSISISNSTQKVLIPSWEEVFTFLIPAIWIISFSPLALWNLKEKNGKNK